ncbi:alpha/beta hydrolase [Amycolatopsis sp. La24]|uniref:alpha/beta fold hydrolase n=1 Tax=Amycolatopsis sp. La24 TaxID=3028304 RepID=UPI0023B0F3BF|nr:alpha/beta hydrolase [Amycolatopsis sp. La24]
MPISSAVDGFRLAYDRYGTPSPACPAVVLLHGWPGDRSDHTEVAALLAGRFDVVVPDLRGFGESDKHRQDPCRYYDRAAQARSIAGLVEELGISRLVVAGYDVGSRVAQHLAKTRPDLVRALVVTPPAPGVGRRIAAPKPMEEFWYQWFHQLELAEELVDGNPDAARAYLRHFWTRWSGPEFALDPQRLEHLASAYGRPGAFAASISWYRAGGGSVASALAEVAPDPAERLAVPTSFLWPERDPLFPVEWSDRLGDFFGDVSVEPVGGVGHFVPVEAPETFARAVREAAEAHGA